VIVKGNGADTTGTIVTPEGEVATKPTVLLTTEEAELLRQYKKFLGKRNLREALYCQDCWNHNLEDGCRAFVTSSQILIECRCKMRFFQGATL
jgi:hypothetical protein